MGLGAHRRIVDGARHVYLVSDLLRHAAGLPIEEVAVEAVIDLDRDGWFGGRAPSAREVLGHLRRILDADLSHPVLLAPDGSLLDGAHRACRAILEGRATVPAIRLPTMPPPSRVE